MQEMSTPKRTYEDIDPDYTDVCEQQTKRQRAIEQDAKQGVCKRIQAIVRNEFQKEINNKEMELHQVDKRLNEARLTMDRLRACIVSTYYRQIHQVGTTEVPGVNGPTSSIHPAVKKCLGKRPAHYEMTSDTSTSHTQKSSGAEISNSDYAYSVHHKGQSATEQENSTSRVTTASQPTPSTSSSSCTLARVPAVPSIDASYDDRRARFKIKKKVIIGNVSKYIPVDHREANDKSSHKWMIYVRGPRSESDISGFVKKVWFFLHHSYKPNDLVEISSPPFQLTRRGWGEFPVRVQLHFVDPRNKKVDIIHQLKLDKTFSGLQTLGAETTVDVDLERDFFEADINSSLHIRPPLSCPLSSSSSSSSLYHRGESSFSSSCKAAPVPAERPLPVSHMGSSVLLKQSNKNLHENSEAGDRSFSCESVMDDQCAPSECLNADMNGSVEGCVGDLALVLESVCEMEVETTGAENDLDVLKEYNVTVVHDTSESDLYEQEEEIIVTDVARTVKDKLESVADSSTAETETPIVSELQDGTQLQQELSLAKSSVVIPQTIISKPQWLKSADTSCKSMSVTPQIPISSISQPQLPTSNISHSLSQLPTSSISSTSANTVGQAQVVANRLENQSLGSVEHNPTLTLASSQPNSHVLVGSSGLLAKPVIKKLCPSVSSLPSSLSILPVLNTAKIIAPPKHISASTLASSSSAKSTIGQSIISLSHLQHQLPKFPQPPHQAPDPQKVFLIKSNLSDVAPQIGVPSPAPAGSISLLQPKPSGPKQVSLLTGRVFTPSTPPQVATKVLTPSHRTKESLLAKNSLVTKDVRNQILASQNLPSQIAKSGSNQVLILKTVSHPALSVSQAADRSANQLHNSANIKLVNGFLGQDVTSHSVNVSLITPDGLSEMPELPLTVLNNCISINNLNSQTTQHKPTRILGSDIILHVPGQSQTQFTNGHSVSSFPKMSAIGITKWGKNSSAVPVVNTNSRSTTDEERKKNQYEVLMEWKRNRHLEEKAKAVAKVARDRIEGEADVIPELNLDDYSSMRALVKAAVGLHPLVQAGVNKLTHPYCAESLEQWQTWTVGKQLGSEWHRACFVLKYLKTLLGTFSSFRGEALMSTRQLVQWSRHHAFSPLIAVFKANAETSNDCFPQNSGTFLNHAHVPSFTLARSLENNLLVETAVHAVDDGGRQEIDVVAAEDIDNNKMKKLANQIQEIQESCDANKNLEWLPPSEGATFVCDQLRKRGIKLQPTELEQEVLAHTAADMLYTAMQEFIVDVLREAAAVSSSRPSHSSTVEITRKDVHTAMTRLPEAAFACDQFLGKDVDVNDGSGR